MPDVPSLYHAPMACSLAAIIAASEGEVAVDIIRVDLGTKRLADGANYLDIHPLGLVSALQRPGGALLTETSTILIWLQSQSENGAFRRAPETDDYFELLKWISFCATEIHKQLFRIVFYDEATPEVKDRFRDLAASRFAVLDAHLERRDFLVGDSFSAADAYLIWALILTDRADVKITPFRHLTRYRDQMRQRPHVKAAIDADLNAS